MSALIWHGGTWHADRQPMLLGPLDHAMWMASVAFDGARSFEGLAPDLDRHCARLIESAGRMLLEPTLSAAEVEALCREGLRRLPRAMATYIRPMFFARRGFVLPEPGSTEFCLAIHAMPMPPARGQRVCFSSFRRPARDMAPTDAKASCLYPNMQRALIEARERGCESAITCDPSGNIAELATANLWLVKDGVALTPAWNGTFLNGITRQRVLQLLRADGIEVVEATLTREDVLAADELFSTGNFAKVLPIIEIEGLARPVGPVTERARALYFAFARSQPIA
jgi:branched-chain amino acid aminotransferase